MTFNAFEGPRRDSFSPPFVSSQPVIAGPGGGLGDGRPRLSPEPLQALAREYAARLRDAGYSVAQGIMALQHPAHGPNSHGAGSTHVAAEIRELEDLARGVLGADAAQWLKQPHALLCGNTPASLMLAPCGRKKVRQLLKAYELAA